MKKLTIILFTILLLPLTSCLHNNGDIGPWFGQWKVTELLIDGQNDPDYKGDLFFCFQSSTLKYVRTLPHIDRSSTMFANWEESNGEMEIIVNGGLDTGLSKYAHVEKEMVYTVVKRNGDKILKYTASDGHEYTYKLTKW